MAKRKPTERTISAELRQAIADSGLTHYAIGKAAGVSPAVISRFSTGERGLTLAVADRLCQALNLGLSTREKVQ
jgi:transcriptional regulator with XRE-family HTH domain